MAQDIKNTENDKKDLGKKLPLILIFLGIIAVLLIVIIFLIVNNKSTNVNSIANTANEVTSQIKRDVIINEKNAESVVSEMLTEEHTPIGYYEVTMNSTWTFEDGSSASSNAYVENVTRNTNSVYFDVVRVDTDETIYASPILTVGTHIDNIVLDTPLEAGTYDCVCQYHLLDEDNNPISSVNVGVTIVINN